MIVTALALQLALAQAADLPAAGEASPPAAEERSDAWRVPVPPPAEPAAEPSARGEGEAAAPVEKDELEELKGRRELPEPTTMMARSRARSAIVPIPSLLSAEPLDGHAAVLGWAGWSSIGAAWAQGLTAEDDLGVTADLDWSVGELRASLYYRRPMGRVGIFDIGSRLRAGWYANFGARWFHDDNLADRGVEFVPGLVASARGAGGVFSVGGDLPLTVTLRRDGGLFAAPKVSLAYETLLYGDLSVGIRVAGSYRAGAGDAPMADPRPLLDLHVLAGWRLF